MMPRSRPLRRRAALLLLALALAPAVQADGRRDHEQARAALSRGEVLPLEPLLAQAERLTGGRAIDVDFDTDDGRPVYELELLLPDGRVIELALDARDGSWLKLEGRRLEQLFARGATVAPPAGARAR